MLSFLFFPSFVPAPPAGRPPSPLWTPDTRSGWCGCSPSAPARSQAPAVCAGCPQCGIFPPASSPSVLRGKRPVPAHGAVLTGRKPVPAALRRTSPLPGRRCCPAGRFPAEPATEAFPPPWRISCWYSGCPGSWAADSGRETGRSSPAFSSPDRPAVSTPAEFPSAWRRR